ncbi:MAG: hypothetical protein HKN73_05965 [Gemmatimonadetes bacterium]|nr:hypothetical protein [Gemmatimonadota bacterium]
MPRILSALLVLVIPTAALHAQESPIAEGLTWRSIGPAVTGGRVTDIEVVPGSQSHIYVGTASGGVWTSQNHGTTWEPVFDDAGNLSVGDLALAPSDPLEIWVGTGEANNRNSSPWGEGIYHSSDGGKTWTLKGLEETRHIGRIVIHPSDPDVVWVAAVGHLFGSNPERGVYKTTDRGTTWERVLYVDDDTGAIDLVMDPADPQILYAATYQRRRRAWGFVGGGPGSGIHKTTDGGTTWREVSEGLPQGDMGRIGLAVSPRNPNLIMAVVEADDGGVFRSEDKGESWRKVNDLNQRPMYYSTLRIDPNDEQRVYQVAGALHRSTDGGASFTALPMELEYNMGVHVDHHALWIDPEDSDHMILGNDGGVYSTWDRGDNWTFIANLPIGQFYDVDLDMADPYYVYGGLQDNNSYRGPSRTRRYQGILNRDWQVVDYGDGMYAEADWSDPGTVYVTSQNAGIVRVNVATGDRKALKPFPRDTADEYRFDWKSPILVSPHDSDRVYLGGNRLFISDDRGVSWRETDDLTRQLHQDSIPIMGILPDSTTLSKHDGASGYGEITAVSESPVTRGVLWVGADDGTVQVSRDDGLTWTDVTERIPGTPFPYYVSWVEASHHEAGRAYVSLDGHWDDDYDPHLFVTEDFGVSWRSVADHLASRTVNVVREHPDNPDLLFVGAEDGVYGTRDRGVTWARLGSGLPAVPVDDLEIHPRDQDLVAGTHGRGIWILDDISPLAQASSAGPEAPQLVEPRPATLFLYRNDVPSVGQGTFRARNPTFGANIDYWLPGPVDEVELRILNGSGEPVRTLPGTTDGGLNRVTWDLRHDPLPHDTTRYDVPQLDAGARGPLVLPSSYAVELSVGGETYRTSLEVRPDPDLPVPGSERVARYEFTLALYALQKRGYEQGIRAYDLDRGREDALAALDSAGVERSEELDELFGRIEEVAGEWRAVNNQVRNWWTGLVGQFDGGPSTVGSLTGPSDEQQRRLARVRERADEAETELEAVMEEVVPRLNELLEAAGVEPVGGGS